MCLICRHIRDARLPVAQRIGDLGGQNLVVKVTKYDAGPVSRHDITFQKLQRYADQRKGKNILTDGSNKPNIDAGVYSKTVGYQCPV